MYNSDEYDMILREDYEMRAILCMECEFNKGICTKCGCIVAEKIIDHTEECPVGKWKGAEL